MEISADTIKDKYACIILTLYVTTNLLFVDCYSMRVTNLHWLLSILYVVGFVSVFLLMGKWLKQKVISKKTIIVLSTMYILIMELIQYHFDPLQIRVDRWSAIHYFLDNLFDGVYPYLANTHLGGYGSPFPVWQIIHIPFYFLHNVGLSWILFFSLFILSIYHIYGSKAALCAWFLYVISPATAYEIVVRSDLISNMLLVAIVCMWLIHKNVHLDKNYILVAIISGLLLSTRLIAVVPLAMLYGFEFINLKRKQLISFIFITLVVFCLTLLPFAFWNSEMFFGFEYSPFRLQTSQANWLVGLIVIIAFILALGWRKNIYRYFIHTDILLFLIVCITFLGNMISSNDWHLFLSSAYDLTYFNMAMPFYITTISILTESNAGTRLSFLDD